MELIPILHTLLLTGLGLLIFVLLYSKFHRKEKQNNDVENYKEIITQRKIAYSREQMEYLKKMRDRHNGGIRNEYPDSGSSFINSSSNRSAGYRNTSDSTPKNNATNYFHPNRSNQVLRSQRFSVLNESINNKPENKKSESRPTFYPVNFYNTSEDYG